MPPPFRHDYVICCAMSRNQSLPFRQAVVNLVLVRQDFNEAVSPVNRVTTQS